MSHVEILSTTSMFFTKGRGAVAFHNALSGRSLKFKVNAQCFYKDNEGNPYVEFSMNFDEYLKFIESFKLNTATLYEMVTELRRSYASIAGMVVENVAQTSYDIKDFKLGDIPYSRIAANGIQKYDYTTFIFNATETTAQPDVETLTNILKG